MLISPATWQNLSLLQTTEILTSLRMMLTPKQGEGRKGMSVFLRPPKSGMYLASKLRSRTLFYVLCVCLSIHALETNAVLQVFYQGVVFQTFQISGTGSFSGGDFYAFAAVQLLQSITPGLTVNQPLNLAKAVIVAEH